MITVNGVRKSFGLRRTCSGHLTFSIRPGLMTGSCGRQRRARPPPRCDPPGGARRTRDGHRGGRLPTALPRGHRDTPEERGLYPEALTARTSWLNLGGSAQHDRRGRARPGHGAARAPGGSPAARGSGSRVSLGNQQRAPDRRTRARPGGPRRRTSLLRAGPPRRRDHGAGAAGDLRTPGFRPFSPPAGRRGAAVRRAAILADGGRAAGGAELLAAGCSRVGADAAVIPAGRARRPGVEALAFDGGRAASRAASDATAYACLTGADVAGTVHRSDPSPAPARRFTEAADEHRHRHHQHHPPAPATRMPFGPRRDRGRT
ncbi:hypothetical protein QJS66_07240 [Kocuria rhizophila]|nr:hypothetical protein QJS66_07240 [Kocuria rhizophila]